MCPNVSNVAIYGKDKKITLFVKLYYFRANDTICF